MHTLSQLEKQQVGLRLPKYLLDEIDGFTQAYSLNRTDIIIEALKSYVNQQKEKIFYSDFEESAQELKEIINSPKKPNSRQSLNELINELDNN